MRIKKFNQIFESKIGDFIEDGKFFIIDIIDPSDDEIKIDGIKYTEYICYSPDEGKFYLLDPDHQIVDGPHNTLKDLEKSIGMEDINEYSDQKYESLTSQPRYLKDRFILFSKPKVNIDFAKNILKRYNVTEIDEYMDSAFLVKSSLDIIESIVGDYPEFFESYSRVDINLEEAWEGCDQIIDLISDLRDSLGHLNRWGSNKIPKDWNDNIDNIIDILKKMKID